MATIPLYNDGQMPGTPEVMGLSAVPVARYEVNYEALGRKAAEAHMQPLMPKDMYDGDVMAGQAWGKALGQVSEVLQDLAKEERRVRDAGNMADSENQMRTSLAEYQKGLDPKADSATALAGWQQVRQKLEKQIFAPGRFSRPAEQNMRLRFERYSTDTEIHLSADAAKRTASVAREQFSGLGQTAESQGDYEVALTANEGMTDAQLQPREAGVARAAQLTRARNRESLFAFIRKDPPVALAELGRDDSPMLRDETPRGREVARTFVRAETARHEYRTVQHIKGAYDADEEDGGDGLAAYEMDLREETRGRMVGMMRGEWEMNDPVNFEEGFLAAMRYNAKLDPSGEKLARLQTDLATKFNGPMEDEVQQALLAQVERTGSVGTNAMDDELVATQGRITHALKSGVFGEWKVPGVGVTWDEEAGSWMRAGGVVPYPIRLARSQRAMLAKWRQEGGGTSGVDSFVDDMDAKEAAAMTAGNIRASIAKGMKEGRYATPIAMREEFGQLMHPHLVRSLRRSLQTDGTDVA